jgi:hypothetical protein
MRVTRGLAASPRLASRGLRQLHRKVCDDPAGEVSNHLTARGGEVDAA